MGCTSSAPNTIDSQTSKTENLDNNMMPSDNSEDLNKDYDKTNSNGQQELEQKQVLPECEIFTNETKVVRNINILGPDSDNMDNKEIEDNVRSEMKVNNTDNSESKEVVENLLTLKDVVDKVILENAATNVSEITNAIEIQNADVDKTYVEQNVLKEKDSKEDVEIDSDDENGKESSSPTQSEDSRATRWEALADIAAELPPSLAVDPLTGQIYSLAK